MSFSSSKLVTSAKPTVIKPPYSTDARRAGRFAGAAFLVNIAVNLLTLSLGDLELGTFILIAVTSRLVILALVVFATVHAIRALRELAKPGSTMRGRGEAIAALVIAILFIAGTAYGVAEIIRLLA